MDYLRARLRARYGDGDWLLTLYGGMNDAERDAVKRQFNNPKSGARLLIATDAAGEGLNLQRAARLMLHWDIPWNPGKMEQRNGRLDRHGQERDVEIFHFDSTDDASMRFLGKVLRKRSQTREDRVVTDEIFADAILAHFELEEDAGRSESRLNRAIGGAKLANAAAADDLPDGVTMPGAADRARLDALKAELDLSPTTLRDTLETAMAVESSRPRLLPDGPGRDRLVTPCPRSGKSSSTTPCAAATPAGRWRWSSIPPTTYRRAPAARCTSPSPTRACCTWATRSTTGSCPPSPATASPAGPSRAPAGPCAAAGCPGDLDALVLLTIEELAVNELREPCHHWVRTLALPVRGGSLGPPLPHLPASAWAMGPSSAAPSTGDQSAAREIWGEVEDEVKQAVVAAQKGLTTKLRERMKQAGKLVIETERRRFEKRRKELERAISDNHIASIRREAAQAAREAQAARPRSSPRSAAVRSSSPTSTPSSPPQGPLRSGADPPREEESAPSSRSCPRGTPSGARPASTPSPSKFASGAEVPLEPPRRLDRPPPRRQPPLASKPSTSSLPATARPATSPTASGAPWSISRPTAQRRVRPSRRCSTSCWSPSAACRSAGARARR
ncbi:MAG: hypothetical protein IPI35_20485 [Deltaproteobacteria bacterium]|nr:hypothetical protein [Deltaproteobacteria bacterium]